MAQTERPTRIEGRQTEKGKFNVLDREGIAKLVSTNLPAQVISNSNLVAKFGEEGEKFRPSLLQPIQTVRVHTADGEEIELILDGHHRAKYMNDHYEELIGTAESPGKHPDLQVITQDATDEVLSMFDKTYTGKGQSTLSMAQYWINVIPHTHSHGEIETKRTISHLLTGWPNHVGKRLADKYSAFAALLVLTDEKRFSPKYHKNLPAYLLDMFDSEPEKEKLTTAMVGMENVLSEAKLASSYVREEASLLVGPEVESIGGRSEGDKQILSLLELPPVQSKLPLTTKIDMRRQLSDTFASAGNTIPSRINLIYTVLTDPQYSHPYMQTILTAKSPERQKKEIDRKMKIDKRIQEYKEHVKRDKLTPTEERFLSKNITAFFLIEEADAAVKTARRRFKEIPAGSPLRDLLDRRVDSLLRAPATQIRSAIQNLENALADTADTKHREIDRSPSTAGQPSAQGSEVVILRRAVLGLQEQFRKEQAAKIAAIKEVERLQGLLKDAGVVYQADAEPESDKN